MRFDKLFLPYSSELAFVMYDLNRKLLLGFKKKCNLERVFFCNGPSLGCSCVSKLERMINLKFGIMVGLVAV